MEFLEATLQQIKKTQHTPKIIFPQTDNKNLLIAILKLYKMGMIQPVLICKAAQIQEKIVQLDNDFADISFFDADDYSYSDLVDTMILQYYELNRLRSNFSYEKAELESKNNYIMGLLLLKNNFADACVALDTFNANFITQQAQLILDKDKIARVMSSLHLIHIQNPINNQYEDLIFTDCILNAQPSAQDLFEITCSSVNFMQRYLNAEPKVAFLSFSTYGSNQTNESMLVKDASELFRKNYPHIYCMGEVQADVALNPTIAINKIKGIAKDQLIQSANIFIFPDLNSANIALKLIEHFNNAKILGPLFHDFAEPFCILPTDIQVKDMMNLIALTALESIKQN